MGWACLQNALYCIRYGKWGDVLLHSSMLSDDSRKKLLAFISIEDGLGYGLCVLSKRVNGDNMIALGGNVPWYSTVIFISGNTVLAVLCNLSDYCGKNLSYAEEIAKTLLLELY
jgi:hypothetical protein